MRVVGLISGGKDSIYNILQCISANHEIVALANIYPEPAGVHELDSYMFQTVGHEGIEFIADAIGLPLYRQSTKGKAYSDALAYECTLKDEVEDLYSLLLKVKNEMGCEGVAVGAIASDYQRLRVENVCARLNLTSLCYLWRQDQAILLKEMILANIDAITVKVASMGLDPKLHLGISIKKLEPIVTSLNSKYGVNVCGEGGEYETFVLDCPLFHKKIVVEESKVVKEGNADIAASAHLIIQKAFLEPKYGDEPHSKTLSRRLEEVRRLVASPFRYVAECQRIETDESFKTNDLWEGIEEKHVLEKIAIPHNSKVWKYVANVGASDIICALQLAKEKLSQRDLTLRNVTNISLWLEDMGQFAAVNKKYVEELNNYSPTRACVASNISPNAVLLELTASPMKIEQDVHVQSVSHWAPANIGPYSQGIKAGRLVFVSGQIPLVPGTMTLLSGPLEHQVRLCLRHSSRILQTCGVDIQQALIITVYVSKAEDTSVVLKILQNILPHDSALAVAAVQKLPRNADVEILLTADSLSTLSASKYKIEDDCIDFHFLIKKSEATQSLVGYAKLKEGATIINRDSIDKIFGQCLAIGTWSVSFKCLYLQSTKGLEESLRLSAADKNITLAPIIQLPQTNGIFLISGLDA